MLLKLGGNLRDPKAFLAEAEPNGSNLYTAKGLVYCKEALGCANLTRLASTAVEDTALA